MQHKLKKSFLSIRLKSEKSIKSISDALILASCFLFLLSQRITNIFDFSSKKINPLELFLSPAETGPYLINHHFLSFSLTASVHQLQEIGRNNLLTNQTAILDEALSKHKRVA
jgi:hypothetical protein